MKKHFRHIMGRNCILELLKSSPERIVEVYTCQKSPTDALYKEIKRLRIPLIEMPKNTLSKLVESESHQSYVASVKERGQPSIKEFLKNSEKKENSIVLMLDSIYDPQNLGAIIRAGECFGTDLILFSKNRGADITPVATKTSAGATELVPIVKVSNLADTLKAFQKAGFWAVAAEAKDGAESLNTFQFPNKTLLILGSEGKGIQPLLSKNCDFHVLIPMLGKIDSLNVSQAAAVFLSNYQKSH